MMDRDRRLVRFNLRSPDTMEFVRFEMNADTKSVVSLRNVQLNLDDTQLYSVPRRPDNDSSPEYSNVNPRMRRPRSEIFIRPRSHESSGSFDDASTVIRVPIRRPPPVPSIYEEKAKRVFERRQSMFNPRPVMEKVDMSFLNSHTIMVDCLPVIPCEVCHSMRFWLCVRYVEAMLFQKRAINYIRVCYHFGVLMSPVKRVVDYNLKNPDSVKTPVYYNLYSPGEVKSRKKLIFNFGRVYDIVQYYEIKNKK